LPKGKKGLGEMGRDFEEGRGERIKQACWKKREIEKE